MGREYIYYFGTLECFGRESLQQIINPPDACISSRGGSRNCHCKRRQNAKLRNIMESVTLFLLIIDVVDGGV